MLGGAVADAVGGSGALEATHVALQGAEAVDQQPIDPAAQTELTIVLMLLIGTILIAGKPVYVNRVVRDVRDVPVACFAWGIVTLAVLLFLIFAFAITVVGAFVAIPLMFVLAALALGGNVLAYLAVLEDTVGNRWVSLVVATLVVVFASLIGPIGVVVNFVVGSIGMGAMVRRWMD